MDENFPGPQTNSTNKLSNWIAMNELRIESNNLVLIYYTPLLVQETPMLLDSILLMLFQYLLRL